MTRTHHDLPNDPQALDVDDLPTIEALYDMAPSGIRHADPEDTPYFGRRPASDTRRWADVTDGSYLLGLVHGLLVMLAGTMLAFVTADMGRGVL